MQHNIHPEAPQSEKANTHIDPGKKEQCEGMSVHFRNDLLNYRYLKIVHANGRGEKTENTGQKRMCNNTYACLLCLKKSRERLLRVPTDLFLL